MPITNTQGAFNIGRDLTLVLIGPYGRVQLDNLVSFDAKQSTHNVKVDRLDGVQLISEIPQGWSGSITLERGGHTVDDLVAQMEQAWYAFGSQATSQIYTYITETDGSTSTYRYDNVALKLDDAGSWKSDASVKVTISWMANRRTRV